MDIDTLIISVLSSLGISGIIGIYLQHLWAQKEKTESRMQGLNVNHYKSTLVWMRLVLDPKLVDHFNVGREDPALSKITNAHEIKYYARQRLNEFYYGSVLFYPDEVLVAMKDFIVNPSEQTFIITANAMRQDLSKKKTKLTSEILSLEHL